MGVTIDAVLRRQHRTPLVAAAVVRALAGCWLAILLVAGSACEDPREIHLDETAQDEIDACGKNPASHALPPPPGVYQDQQLTLDYVKLSWTRASGGRLDSGYITRTYTEPARLEQVYFDATHGNKRAIWARPGPGRPQQGVASHRGSDPV